MSSAFKKIWLFNLYIFIYFIVAIFVLVFSLDYMNRIPIRLVQLPGWVQLSVFMFVFLILCIPLRMLQKKRRVFKDKYEQEKATKKHERVSEIARKLIAKRDQSKSETKIII